MRVRLPAILSGISTVLLIAATCWCDEAPRGRPYGLEVFTPVDTSRLMGSPDPVPPLKIEKAFPNLHFQRPLEITHAGDGTNRLFVVTQKGIVYGFPNRPDVGQHERKVFLNWSPKVRTDENEEGMMGLAFHPKYKENGLLYVYYTTRPLQSVVARFRVMKGDPDRADPNSFEILLNFPQPYSNHNGGSMEFGPDGFLYIGLGDGGAGNDPHGNGQNLKTLLGKILRIDVDREDSGRKYAIAKDNPFADREDNVRKEIWAYGVRNIWRLSFDRLTGALWAGDVGQDRYEEIDLIVKGGNYGWNLREGTHPFRPNLAPAGERLIEPVLDYDHSVGKSVTGGVVYRGRELPELYGAYLYADYVSGPVWALRYNGEKVTSNVQIVRPKPDITSFGQDEANEVYFTNFDGFIYRFRHALQKTSPEYAAFPRKLSETGLFESVRDLKPAAGLIPYTVNVPLWSDDGVKQRYIALPKGGAVKFSPGAPWEFPVGTVLVKTFLWEAARGEPSSRRRLETRLMVLSRRGWDGYTYLWNDAQSDAQLLDAAVTRRYEVHTSQGAVQQPWYFPSRADCMACHTQAAGWVLGLNTRQMNRPQDYGTIADNQLRTLDHLGVFQEHLPTPGDRLQAYPDWTASIEPPKPKWTTTLALARAYLDVNCAICHCPGGTSNTNLDLRFSTPTANMGLLNAAPVKGQFGPPNSKLVTPGDPRRSILLTRMNTRGEGKMPNLATSVVDEKAVRLIQSWIESLTP